MKNVILIAALAMLIGTIVLKPLNTQAQSAPAQNAPAQDPKQIEFIRTWHEACSKNDAENAEKCCQLSKELTDKYPNAEKNLSIMRKE
jgi:invasion protein IalB